MYDLSDMDGEAKEHDGQRNDASAYVAENLRRILDEKGLAATTVSKRAGLSRSALPDIITRRAGSPRHATIVAIAKELGVEVSDLLSPPRDNQLTEDERRILHALSQLSGDKRQRLLAYAEGMLDGLDP